MRWSDMDQMGHINNAVYLTYFEHARGYYYHESCEWNWKEDGIILANASIDYLRPIVFPSTCFIYVRTTKIGNKSMDLEYIILHEENNAKTMMARGTTTLVMFDYKTQGSIVVPDRIREKIKNYEIALV